MQIAFPAKISGQIFGLVLLAIHLMAAGEALPTQPHAPGLNIIQ